MKEETTTAFGYFFRTHTQKKKSKNLMGDPTEARGM